MAAKSWDGLQPRLQPEGADIPEFMTLTEKAGQSFKAGCPLKLTTTAGTVEIVTAAACGFVGIALEDASGVTSAEIKVQICRPDTPIVARVSSGGTLEVPSTAMITGVAYDLYLDANSVVTVDSASPGNATLIYERPIFDVNGDETYWGIFRILPGQAGNIDEAAA